MFRVPFADFSTRRLLTMTWLDGRPLMARLAEDPPQEERNRIAEALFRAWYVPFYRFGVIHGDPHLGNYQVRPDGSVNLLDFGAIPGILPTLRRRGSSTLYEAVRDGDERQGAPRLRDLGLHGPLPREDAGSQHVGEFLYEPYRGSGPPHPGDRRSTVRPGNPERVHARLSAPEASSAARVCP